MDHRKPTEDTSLKHAVTGGFFRLGIAKKLFLGYMPLAALIIVISAFTLSNLEKLNKINASIIRTDLYLIDIGDKMIDSVLAQELYGRRFAILKSSEMLTLFWTKSDEFEKQLNFLRNLPDKDIPAERLKSLHDDYNETFRKLAVLAGPSSSVPEEYDMTLKKRAEEVIGLIKKMLSDARNNQNQKALMTSEIGARATRVTWILSTFGIFFGVASAILITRNISKAVSELKHATKRISEGKFDHISTVKNRDELGELSAAFNEMALRLKRLEEMYLDASPLTRLPGGVAIENILNKRLEANTPLAFCLIDLDNFKAFSDRYGYAKGSEVIKATGRLIDEAVTVHGAEDDFVGHIGGDDFVVICFPDRFEAICNTIIESFDKMIPDFYDPEDRERGYIRGKTRQGIEIDFPIMTISIAVVMSRDHKFANTIEIGEVAAELKENAKSIRGSNFVTDRREQVFHEVQHKE